MDKRGLKTRKPISNAVDIELLDGFKELSAKTRIPQSKLLDEAIAALLYKYGSISDEELDKWR
jgi:Ribbon-helix-helix domain